MENERRRLSLMQLQRQKRLSVRSSQSNGGISNSIRDSIMKRIEQISGAHPSTKHNSSSMSLSQSVDQMSEANIIDRADISGSQGLSAIDENEEDASEDSNQEDDDDEMEHGSSKKDSDEMSYRGKS